MADLFNAILGTACICASAITLAKICTMRSEVETPYIILKKEDYETLLHKAAEKKHIKEQPPLPPLPPLPMYSEIAPLLQAPSA